MKEYIRKCDCCKKVIPNMYDYGVTTLFRDIRVGRGGHFEDYDKPNIRNQMEVETPDDFDGYGRGWHDDDSKEFNFCSPNCLYEFLGKIFKDVYSHTTTLLKKKDMESTKAILEDIEKRKKMNPIQKFFDRSKVDVWVDSAIEELKELQKDTEEKLKVIKSLKKK